MRHKSIKTHSFVCKLTVFVIKTLGDLVKITLTRVHRRSQGGSTGLWPPEISSISCPKQNTVLLLLEVKVFLLKFWASYTTARFIHYDSCRVIPWKTWL